MERSAVTKFTSVCLPAAGSWWEPNPHCPDISIIDVWNGNRKQQANLYLAFGVKRMGKIRKVAHCFSILLAENDYGYTILVAYFHDGWHSHTGGWLTAVIVCLLIKWQIVTEEICVCPWSCQTFLFLISYQWLIVCGCLHSQEELNDSAEKHFSSRIEMPSKKCNTNQ